MSGKRAIGGVMPAEPAGLPASGSIWEAWAAPFAYSAAFANARSALAAVLGHRGRPRVWLPAYACPSLVAGASRISETRVYPVGDDLEPELEDWTTRLAPGDAVVVVDYFGRPPGQAWRHLRAANPEVFWIEDRAQALDPAAAAFGDVVIYSSRKLLGVGDGGLVFSARQLPQPTAAGRETTWAPEDARASDPDGRSPERWRPLFQAREADMEVGHSAASRRTMAALQSVLLRPLADRRRANWARLAEWLPDHALWPTHDPSFSPLAFPILAEDAAQAAQALAAERVWAPRHWADPPSDAAAFPRAHWLAAHCVSLPIDQRYGEADMARVASVVSSKIRPARPSSRSRPPSLRSHPA